MRKTVVQRNIMISAQRRIFPTSRLLPSRILKASFPRYRARFFCQQTNAFGEPYTIKEKIYDIIHRSIVLVILSVTTFLFLCVGFLTVKIHKQHKKVQAQMKQVKFFRDVMCACPEIFEGFNPKTMDVSQIYNYFLPYKNSEGNVSLDVLTQDPMIQGMMENSVPIFQIVDWASMGHVRFESLVYMFSIIKYFSLYEKRDETKKLKREIGDRMYKIMKSYNKIADTPNRKVTMRNVIALSEAGFGMALLSAPDLGYMTLDEYMPMFVQGMLDDEDLQMTDFISRRSFDLLHKAQDYHIGLRRELRSGTNSEIR